MRLVPYNSTVGQIPASMSSASCAKFCKVDVVFAHQLLVKSTSPPLFMQA